MLTKEQILEAEAEANQPIAKHPNTQAPNPVLAVTLDLEARAAEQLNCAVQCLERGDRRSARAHIQMSENLLNEAEIED